MEVFDIVFDEVEGMICNARSASQRDDTISTGIDASLLSAHIRRHPRTIHPNPCPAHPNPIICTPSNSLPNEDVKDIRRAGGARNGIGGRWKPYSVCYESAIRIHRAGAYAAGIRGMAIDYGFRRVALKVRWAIAPDLFTIEVALLSEHLAFFPLAAPATDPPPTSPYPTTPL